MGLPHVVVRFYTNPDGRAARRTTLVVLALLGAFYLLPPVYGALGRIYAADLATAGSDALVLELPRLMVDGLLGEVLTGLVTAGAFAAFLSTSSGLSIAVAGVLSQDVTGRRFGDHRLSGVAAFRAGAVIAVVVPALVSIAAPDVGVARTVGLAFAVAASTFCPLLLLGIWWRGLTAVGAIAGLAVGGLGSGLAVGWTLVTSETTGWVAVLLGQPAAWSVPAALATMVVVSRATRSQVPAHAGRFMVRLHTPGVRRPAARPDRSSRQTDRSPTRPDPPGDVPSVTLAAHPCGGATVTAITPVTRCTKGDRREPSTSTDQADAPRPGLRPAPRDAGVPELRRRYRGFVFPATVAFLAWYLALRRDVELGGRLHGHQGRRQHQRRAGLRPAAVRHDVRARLGLRRYSNAKLDPLARELDEQYARPVGVDGEGA